MISTQTAGRGVGAGLGRSVGRGVGDGVGLGVGEGVGLGVGEGVGLGVGDGLLEPAGRISIAEICFERYDKQAKLTCLFGSSFSSRNTVLTYLWLLHHRDKLNL